MAANGPLTVAAILVAAGDGLRLGADVPKAFVRVGGRTLLEHASSTFCGHPEVGVVVVAAPPALTEQAREVAPAASVVGGGLTRQQSVSLALAVVREDVDVVLVHDVARPFVPAEVITRVIAAIAAGADAAVPTVPVTDTIRRHDPRTGELGAVVDRSELLAMQTPQGFRRAVLVRAHASGAGSALTDDAALVEALGARVVPVRGDERSFKITVAHDLVRAEALARG